MTILDKSLLGGTFSSHVSFSADEKLRKIVLVYGDIYRSLSKVLISFFVGFTIFHIM